VHSTTQNELAVTCAEGIVPFLSQKTSAMNKGMCFAGEIHVCCVCLPRDKFMKEGGSLYPSHARMFLAPIRTNVAEQRVHEFQNAMEGWAEFIQQVQSYYQVGLGQ
jgi:hypothetical protein